MDPFNEVQSDAVAQLDGLKAISKRSVTQDAVLDFDNASLELQETINDLHLAVAAAEADPKQFGLGSDEISLRRQHVEQLRGQFATIQSEWSQKRNDPHRPREVTTMSNRISQDDGANPFSDRNHAEISQFQQQEMEREQDVHLGAIHDTMQKLNQQAMMMGDELEQQGFMLEDLDQEMDTVGGKLRRGMKRVNFVLEKNRERASDCCIVLLVIALCVLLVIIIAV